MSLLRSGDKLLLAHRRLFDDDAPRFFAGYVDEYEDDIARVCGYTFVRDSLRGGFLRKSEARTKLVSLSSGTLIVYLLPSETQLAELHMEEHGAGQADHRLVLTDGAALRMDLSDRAA